MKRIYLLYMGFVLVSCIGEDIIDDSVPEVIRITTTNSEIEIGNTIQLEASYFNNVGEETPANINWESSDEGVLAINNSGLATAIDFGTVTVTASANDIEDSFEVSIVEDPDNTPMEITGEIFTTSSYNLEGNFTLSVVDGTNLNLSLDDTYIADTALPGLYIYLSNNPNAVSDALEIGPVTVFNGEHSYLIENTAINDYAYIVYWCNPFSVKVGQGNLQN